MPVTFAPQKIQDTAKWIASWRVDWEYETPQRIHRYGTDDGHGLGGPPFTTEFERWIGPICFCGRKPDRNIPGDKGCPSNSRTPTPTPRNHEVRLRTTKAFRKLRKVAPREFDVLYLMCALGSSFDTALQSLNERAERLGKTGYSSNDLLLLVVSGVDKVKHYW